MTKEELIKILEVESGDRELDHVNADKALLRYINDEEITKAFAKVFKWYA